MQTASELAERHWVPDFLIRKVIRALLKNRLRDPRPLEVAALATGALAIEPDQANLQHYEVPASFFRSVLGPHLKYSSCLWSGGARDLAEAEEAMLASTCERAQLADGQDVLELGCGWGSLTLWMAARFPNARIVTVSNCHSQREFISELARERRLSNVTVVTADMNVFAADRRFDRVVSVEMFEHMRNWTALLDRVHGWLKPDGRLFLHFFAHRCWTYAFEADGDDNWMGRHFFTGGIMPSAHLLHELGSPFEVEAEWTVDGREYARTAEAWLRNLDANRRGALAALSDAADPDRALQRWRIFFLACAELFAFNEGREWIVRHALLRPRTGRRGSGGDR